MDHFETFETGKADYAAAKHNRFSRPRTGLPSGGSGADYHLRNENDYYRILEIVRDLDRNDAIVGQVLNRAVDNTIQGGFTFLPETGDEKLDEDLYYRWLEWAQTPELCDLAGELTWHDIEWNACRSVLLDGDCILKAVKEGQLEYFEAHQCNTSSKHKNTFLGVTTDSLRRPTSYWLGAGQHERRANRRQKERFTQYGTRSAVGLRLIFHVLNRRRVTLTRGMTALHPIVTIAGILDDINFSKLVQQQIVSCFVILREKEAAAQHGLPRTGNSAEYANAGIEAVAGQEKIVEEVAPGMEVEGNPGESLKGFSPNIPNAEFFDQYWLQISMVGANLGLAPSQVLLDFSRENFVGYRGALHEARRGIKRNQLSLVNRLHRPVYKWKLEQFAESDSAIMQAKKRLGDKAFFKCKISPPAFDYLEPVNDAAADLLRVRNNLTSRRRMHGERGHDWQEIAEESIEDNAYAIERAIKRAGQFRKDFPGETDLPHWRDLISLPTPDGIQVGITNNQQPTTATAKKKGSSDE